MYVCALNLLHKYIGIGLLAISLCIGLLTFKTYGLTWDETEQHLLGRLSYDYAFNGNDSLLNFEDKEYGVGFELPLILIEKAFHRIFTDSRVTEQ